MISNVHFVSLGVFVNVFVEVFFIFGIVVYYKIG